MPFVRSTPTNLVRQLRPAAPRVGQVVVRTATLVNQHALTALPVVTKTALRVLSVLLISTNLEQRLQPHVLLVQQEPQQTRQPANRHASTVSLATTKQEPTIVLFVLSTLTSLERIK